MHPLGTCTAIIPGQSVPVVYHEFVFASATAAATGGDSGSGAAAPRAPVQNLDDISAGRLR